MSKIINDDLTVVIAPASYAAAESNAVSSPTNPENGLNLIENTTSYAVFSITSSKYAYYTFNINFIPDGAQILEVSAQLRAYVSNTSRPVSATLGYFTADYGESNRLFNTVGNTISINANSLTLYDIPTVSPSPWTREYLYRINLRFTGTSSQSTDLYFYGCSLTIHYTYNGTIYEVTTQNLTPLIGKIYPDGLSDIYPENQPNPYLFTMVGDSIDNIIVEDEVSGTTTDVTSQVILNQSVSGLYTTTKTPTSTKLTGVAYQVTTGSTNYLITYIYEEAVGKGSDASATNTNKYVFRRSAQSFDSYVDYKFDFSDILFNAKIINISVSVKGRSQNSTDYRQVSNVRLYSGDTPKSEVIEFATNYDGTATSDYVVTFQYPGKWTVQELQDAAVRFTFGVYGGYIDGISWSVDYIIEPDFPKYWVYTLNNVYEDHSITVRDNYPDLSYEINTIVYYKNAVEVSNTYRVIRENDDFNLTVYTSDYAHTQLIDNNVDKTNQLTVLSASANAYVYTIDNVTSNHTIKLVEMLNFSIIATSLVEGIDITISSEKVYEGDSFTITVNASSLDTVFIHDNGVDISSQFSLITTNTYRATISNVEEDHELIVVERTKEVLTVLSNSENITISPIGYMSVLEGGSKTLMIKTGANTMAFHGRPTMFTMPKKVVAQENIILKDNDRDVSDALEEVSENMYSYTISNILESHTIVVYELFVPEYENPEYNYYSLSVSSLNAATTPGTGTIRVVEGTDTNISITPIQPVIIVCTDNGVDITDLFEKTFIEGLYVDADPSYTVEDMTSTYKFVLNNNTGYYTSSNNTIPNSQAVARIHFVLPVTCYIEIEYINYAEEGGDYGIFGLVDEPLDAGTGSHIDQNVYLACNTADYNKPFEQYAVYQVAAGEHFIDIKYQKNSNTAHRNNDSLQWKIKSINAQQPYVYYNYTVEDIHQDHSLVFVFGENAYYTVESSGINSRLFPNGTMVKRSEESYSLTIIPDVELFEIVLKDNGIDKSANIVRIESVINKETVVNYIYAINRVTDNHIIEVECKNQYEFYFKFNNLWMTVSKVYKKVNNEWVIIYDYETEFLNKPNEVRVFKEFFGAGPILIDRP